MGNSSKGRRIAVHQGNTPAGDFNGTGDDREDLEECARVLRQTGVPQESAPLEIRIREQARAFAGVAVDLSKNISSLRGHAKMLIAPFLVNSAFSLELFLKALAQKHGKGMRGHSLLELFDGLPIPARQAIDHAFADAPPSLTDFEGSHDLRGLFANLDDAFVKWRYAYEGQVEGRFYGAKAAILLLATLDVATSTALGNSQQR